MLTQLPRAFRHLIDSQKEFDEKAKKCRRDILHIKHLIADGESDRGMSRGNRRKLRKQKGDLKSASNELREIKKKDKKSRDRWLPEYVRKRLHNYNKLLELVEQVEQIESNVNDLVD